MGSSWKSEVFLICSFTCSALLLKVDPVVLNVYDTGLG
ncbi:hypothetical protein KP509_34G031300 [Ceratopteris richardii]|uniref:Uncharacterized protein n=1 Tax=Ceratopteris richardii TaxID=49495 RepID=A0A8T2QJF1_CERRI|nr:hypothetical protein KP509_34G031300 [Ceratopteris richardii]